MAAHEEVELPVRGRAAVVTGAASGIGRSLALEAASRGLRVAIADVDATGLAEVEQALRAAGAEPLVQVLDVRDPQGCRAFAAEVFQWAPSVALVFANAGVMRRTDSLRPDLKVWNDTLDINLRGTVHMVDAFMGRLLDQGEAAQFVITASQAAFLAAPDISPYVATKHAQWGLAESLRIDLKRLGSPVGVSVLAPGRVLSAITLESARLVQAKEGDEALERYKAALLTPEEVASFTLDKLAARAFWITPNREQTTPFVEQRFAEVLRELPRGWLG